MKIFLANPRGFCAGVDRAISIVERALELFKPPIYVRHEVVHNKYVVEGLRRNGAVFVEELKEVPDNSVVIFSAHGVSKAVKTEAQKRQLTVFDATCPLVTKVHMEVGRASRKGHECVLIGHEGHPEVIGTMGQYENDKAGIYLIQTVDDVATLALKNPEEAIYCSQTTLSVDDTKLIIAALTEKYPAIIGPRKDDICYATQNRQEAVRELALKAEVVLVVGAKNSSNSNRLKEVAHSRGATAYLIDTAENIKEEWLKDVTAVGVTAGASAPEILVQQVIDFLKSLGGSEVEETQGVHENVVFALPASLI